MENLTDTEKIFQKWNRVGLLGTSELTISEKINLSQKLEEGAKFLVLKHNEHSPPDMNISAVFLPLIARTFIRPHFNISELYDLIKNNLKSLEDVQNKIKQLLPNTYQQYQTDIELEFIDKIDKLHYGMYLQYIRNSGHPYETFEIDPEEII